MNLINLTPHDINLIDDEENCYLTIQPTLPPAWCEETLHIAIDSHLGYDHDHGITKIPFNRLSYKNVYDLPEPSEWTFYIVSVLVAQAKPSRADLLVPHDLVRKNGRIIGCKRLVRII